uniref:Uncharacterized protein n=1 Tax=Arundo donax TaxID=35708 RepID=A0A0A8ZI25_ARUDO
MLILLRVSSHSQFLTGGKNPYFGPEK